MQYSDLADRYLKQVVARYGGARVNHKVKNFVKGFADYLEKQETRQIKQKQFTNGGIAVISETIGHLTGGRYYTWMIALALKEAGIPVTIYTNQHPNFQDYFSEFNQPKVEIVGRTRQDVSIADIKADVYIGSPIHGALAAIRNGQKYNKPSYPMIFDPFPMIKEYRKKDGFQGWKHLVPAIKDSNCNVLTLCKSVHPYTHEWLNKTEDKLIPIYPCINSLVMNKVPDQERKDFVLFISRLVPNKHFPDVLAACKDNRVNLKVITSASGIDHRRMVQEAGMGKRVEFLFNASDDEKFKLLKQASAFISGSIYEGWGIPHTEALACGTPVVCYQYPTFSEIKYYAMAKNMYMAEWGDHKDLGRKLKLALDEKKFTKGTDLFNFESMVERVKELWAN